MTSTVMKHDRKKYLPLFYTGCHKQPRNASELHILFYTIFFYINLLSDKIQNSDIIQTLSIVNFEFWGKNCSMLFLKGSVEWLSLGWTTSVRLSAEAKEQKNLTHARGSKLSQFPNCCLWGRKSDQHFWVTQTLWTDCTPLSGNPGN